MSAVSLPIDPDTLARGDSVTLRYGAVRKQGQTITRNALVWGTRNDEVILCVRSKESDNTKRNETFTLYVTADGIVYNREIRNDDMTRVKIGDDANLSVGWQEENI